MKNTENGGLKPVPISGSIYYFFDDGKITKGRRCEVKIVDVIPFDKIDKETFSHWLANVEGMGGYSLYDDQTDYFVTATLIDDDGDVLKDDDEDIMLTFARSKGGWFSFGNYLFDGRLDVDGSLNSIVNERMFNT